MISAALGARAWRGLAPLVLIVGLVVAGLTASQAGARTGGGKAPAVGARAQNTDEMVYHNGDVVLHNTTYVVWWDAGVGFASGGDQSAYEDRVAYFLSHLEGTTYYHILSQYYENGFGGPYVGPYTHFGGSYTDFTPPTANPIDSSDVASEVEKASKAMGWPSGLSSIVIVFLPTGYNVCSVGQCSPGDFCAFHGVEQHQDGNGGPIIKTPDVVIPAPSQDLPPSGGGCGAKYTWQDGTVENLWVQSGPAKSADASINIMSHELFEAITDPDPPQNVHNGLPVSGWWDDAAGSTLGEIGDKCAYVFDPFWNQSGHGGPPPPDRQDQEGTYRLGSENFVIQEEWSNSDQRCLYDTLAPPADPETPTATATTQDGSNYTFGTWTNQKVSLTVHAADAPAGLGLDDIAVSVDGNSDNSVPFTPDDDGFHVTSDKYPVLANSGKHTIDVRAHSYSGRQTSARVGEVWYDFAAPDVSLSAPDSPSGWYTSPVAVNVSASDLGSGVASVSCTPSAKVITPLQEYEVDVSVARHHDRDLYCDGRGREHEYPRIDDDQDRHHRPAHCRRHASTAARAERLVRRRRLAPGRGDRQGVEAFGRIERHGHLVLAQRLFARPDGRVGDRLDERVGDGAGRGERHEHAQLHGKRRNRADELARDCDPDDRRHPPGARRSADEPAERKRLVQPRRRHPLDVQRRPFGNPRRLLSRGQLDHGRRHEPYGECVGLGRGRERSRLRKARP